MVRADGKKNVFVGLSGGVDSSVSAALLKEQGYDVTGVFIKVWHPDFLTCNWQAEQRDAMAVAAALDIPFLTLNLEDEYRAHVIATMLDEYRAGRTPNPDVLCNRFVKFGAFLKRAKALGADYVATGHYARVSEDAPVRLMQSADADKDQTYFLWALTQSELKHILFPVGGYTKSEVRDLAASFNLVTAQKHDSQGLCFIGKVSMRDFLKRYIEESSGAVLDTDGQEIGRHDGALFYTIGQRHGFTVFNDSADAKPRYVIAKDLECNTLTVSTQPAETARTKSAVLKEANWTRRIRAGEADSLYARIRHRGTFIPCSVEATDSDAPRVRFREPTVALAPGQSLVLYTDDECLGGGVIA